MFPAWKEDYVVYRDPDILVVFKPAGLPTKPPKEQKHCNLYSYVYQHLTQQPRPSTDDSAAGTAPNTSTHTGHQQSKRQKRKARQLSEQPDVGVQLHVPSRLDSSTQGLVALSISRRTHNPLQQMFSRHAMTKHYLCEVVGTKEALTALPLTRLSSKHAKQLALSDPPSHLALLQQCLQGTEAKRSNKRLKLTEFDANPFSFVVDKPIEQVIGLKTIVHCTFTRCWLL